jgi:aldose sugar dehydrogenase
LESDPLLSDLSSDSDDEISAVTFGTGFTGISEIETGPDGNLYILTFDRETEGQGSLYRILPAGEEGASSAGVPPSMSQDTVTPPVTDDSESEAEDLGEDGDDNGDGDGDDNGDGDDDGDN